MTDLIENSLSSCESMLGTLHSWAEAGWIRRLDAELAQFLFDESQNADTARLSPLLLLAAALCSHQNGHGHLCLDLAQCLLEPDRALLLPPEHGNSIPAVTPAALLSRISMKQWIAALPHPSVCRLVNNSRDDSIGTPLLLSVQTEQQKEHARLYLQRFWRYERQLQDSINHRVQRLLPTDDAALADALNTVFQVHDTSRFTSTEQDALLNHDWQKIACALAVRSQFSIITGGPGTGKTTTVVKLLYVLQTLQKRSSSAALRIRLAAPTGKAAARLSSSITRQVHSLASADNIPTEVTTVHRLLGPIRNSRFFRHHAANPLAADVVVIDEASMVDVELMAQLMEALPDHARLILLGDKDQLASVEAGAVLGSLCIRANAGAYTDSTVSWLQKVTGEQLPAKLTDNNGRMLDQVITMLRYSHRFGSVPGIGRLAEAINRGESAASIQALFNGRFKELDMITLRNTHEAAFEKLITDSQRGYGFYLEKILTMPALEDRAPQWDQWAADILQAHTRFQLLAAVRRGEFGVDELNIRIRNLLSSEGLIPHNSVSDNHEWYIGRPVMITRNDYNLELMNGDVGITLPCPDPRKPGAYCLRVAFRDNTKNERIRWILPTRLQDVETVFAMTVHKSQGSEFFHTALMLPAADSPVLTRELVYTGITRASEFFTLICSNPGILEKAVQTRVFRAGGLEDMLV